MAVSQIDAPVWDVRILDWGGDLSLLAWRQARVGGRCQQHWGPAGEGDKRTWTAQGFGGEKGEQPGQPLLLPKLGYSQAGSFFQGAGQGWRLAGEDSIGGKRGEIRTTRLRIMVSCRCVLGRQAAVSERAGLLTATFFF